MNLADLLSGDAVLVDLKAADKAKALAALSRRAADRCGLEASQVLAALIARETLGSTGFGGGVAVPHARIGGLRQPIAAFARLARPIDFQAVDDRPVDLIFLLLTPEGDEKGHLAALAQISRLLREAARAARLRNARSAEELHAALTWQAG
ncbi:MAG: PTS sugar transporter subunit IIA [Proteobacteria bacterium]|nr:PTS sugar transporter subunit IIA [Pseudomonadota bacterium]